MPVSLLGSNAIQRIIGLLYLAPEGRYTLGDIVDRVGERVGRRTVIRALDRLVNDGHVLRVKQPRRFPVYQANRRSFLFDDLQSIALKTLGGVDRLAHDVVSDPNIEGAFVFGSHAAGTARPDSDIDLLLVVADPRDDRLLETLGALDGAAARLGRRIEPIVTTAEEWRRRRLAGDRFVNRVDTEPRVALKGSAP